MPQLAKTISGRTNVLYVSRRQWRQWIQDSVAKATVALLQFLLAISLELCGFGDFTASLLSCLGGLRDLTKEVIQPSSYILFFIPAGKKTGYLDETLVRETEDSKYANAFYTPMHGSSEFLSVLNAIPNVQMHFFSSGRECRNIPLVQQIMEGCCLRCSYNIFSMSHMTKESGSWDYKKKLENLGFELPWTIMVDDESSDVAATGEEINFLQMYYFSQSEHLQDREVLRLRRENSLIRALGLIIWALELSMIANCTLVQALVAIQWDQNGKYAHQRTNAIQVYEAGLAAMQKVNPNIVLLGCTNNAMVYPWSELKMDHHSNAHEKFWRIGFGKQKIDRLMMHRLQLDVSLPAVKTRDVEEDLCIDALYCQ
ncbi:hypothetical protein SELMODRAFT_419810 [Selaginella moellendorffii]|uniref:FCP1 homology domain-containing protein n=1 Tax=Selaginella moellendorffii TaxID=88036 RepID=D8SAM2_SELML|nr:hypothetical protein SELMODRAFT_419810 [Selaginella moellendorffii]